jgi:hypothetical protein
MDQWNLMMQKINKLNRFVKKNDFYSQVHYWCKVVKLILLVEYWFQRLGFQILQRSGFHRQ